MNRFLIITLLLICLSCNSQKQAIAESDYTDKTTQLFKKIDSLEIKKMLYEYSSDKFKGREAGTEHESISTEYIREFYKNINIEATPGTKKYYQLIPKGTYSRLKGDANNVIAYIKGTDKADEVLVLSAHLDHLGDKNGEIYYGADDNGSGTIAIMQIAKAFKKAERKGLKPRRTLVFLHVTGEEKGLYGSHYYADNPLFSLDKTITNLNIDMIGRVDEEHEKNPRYLYLIGSDKLSKRLKEVSEEVNNKYFNLSFDYKYDDPNDPNRLYYRSDHYNFAKNNIPVIFYFNGIHEDYHRTTDTADKINYPILTERIQLIFSTAWHIANQDESIELDN